MSVSVEHKCSRMGYAHAVESVEPFHLTWAAYDARSAVRVEDITYCPWCGSLLPDPPEEDDQS